MVRYGMVGKIAHPTACYVVETPEGNFNLRDFDTSGTGAEWTIDVPGKLLGSAKGSELKFK